MAKKQLLLDKSFKLKSDFGGDLLKASNPKVARPVSTRDAMHIVLRSSLAKGKYSMLEKSRADRIDKLIRTNAKKFGVKIYQYANVGNHLHLLVLVGHRKFFTKFLKAVSGIIARLVLGAQRGAARKVKFWDQRPWSRIVKWKKDFNGAKKYVIQNFNKALGFVAYKVRTLNVSLARGRRHRSTA
jgi:REP element-mobilizing transposase RayT